MVLLTAALLILGILVTACASASIDWSVIRPGAIIMLGGGTSACDMPPYDFKPSTPPASLLAANFVPSATGAAPPCIRRQIC
jgi:hypothetical protein